MLLSQSLQSTERYKKENTIHMIKPMMGTWRVLWEHLGAVTNPGTECSREVTLIHRPLGGKLSPADSTDTQCKLHSPGSLC